MKKTLFFIAILFMASVLKSQDHIDAGWYLFPDSTYNNDVLGITHLIETKDGNYIASMYDYSNYYKSQDDATIFKINSDGVILNEIKVDINDSYKLNDIVFDVQNDTVNVLMHCIGIHRNCAMMLHSYILPDFTLTEFRQIWSADFEKPMSSNIIRSLPPLIDAQGFKTISYTYSSRYISGVMPPYGKVIFLKIEPNYNVVLEKWIDCEDFDYNHLSQICYTFNEDSTQYNVMCGLNNKPWHCQYVLDESLNIIDTVLYEKESAMNYWEFADQHSYSQNPINGKIYCMTHVGHPTMKYELAVFMLDKTNMKVKMMRCTDTPDNICNTTGLGDFLAYSKNGDIYGMGIYDFDYFTNNPNYECKLYLVKFDENLKKLDEWFYEIEQKYMHHFDHIYCTESDDIIVTGYVVNDDTNYPCIVKFPASAFNSENIEEAHDHGLHLAVAYPNPGGDVLNIRTGLRNAVLTVYDLQGRKIHEEEITDDVTSIDASKWNSGTYVWKLGVRSVELGVKEVESGKWVR
ncbi:MAG: T9SS type A sorting domain-containing protein [Bacteroidales bacterium]|nr:T9SS type A sorting domain-containing protein [Bacteroidales bacterium]